MRDAASEQLELIPVERCEFCGPLDWTRERFGRITHKCRCPHRSDPYCQAHPSLCAEQPVAVKNPNWPLTTLPGTEFEHIFTCQIDESAGLADQ